MVVCPNCGIEVATAIECWTVAPAKHRATSDIPEFRAGIFKCPKCKAKFRSKVDTTAKQMKINVKYLIVKIKEMRESLTPTLKTLREKTKIMETERASLLVEIEKLKRVTESQDTALETEVNRLREELKSLRELLGSSKLID